MELIKRICYNFEAENNKVLAYIQTQKKAMSWRHSKGSTISEYNDQFTNQEKVAEACGGKFKLPGVIDIVLKDKHIGVAVSQLDPISKKALNNEVHGWVLVVLFIENSNRRIYSALAKTLENDYCMGKGNYPREMSTTQKLLVNYKHMENPSGATSDGITFATDGRPRTQKDK